MSERKVLDGRKVLVADDEPFNLSIVVRMMRELGCPDVMSATTGTEALSYLDGFRAPPDLCMLDFNMPGSNGLQILKQVRIGALPVPRELAHHDADRQFGFWLGRKPRWRYDVDAFIIKPVSLQAMAARLEKALSGKQEVKAKPDYLKIDIDAVSQRLLSRKPVGLAKTKQTKKTGPTGIPTRLEFARPGMILSEEVRSPDRRIAAGQGDHAERTPDPPFDRAANRNQT